MFPIFALATCRLGSHLGESSPPDLHLNFMIIRWINDGILPLIKWGITLDIGTIIGR